MIYRYRCVDIHIHTCTFACACTCTYVYVSTYIYISIYVYKYVSSPYRSLSQRQAILVVAPPEAERPAEAGLSLVRFVAGTFRAHGQDSLKRGPVVGIYI